MRCEAVVFIAVSYARRCAAIPGENGPAPRWAGGRGTLRFPRHYTLVLGGGKCVSLLVLATTKVPLSSPGLQRHNAGCSSVAGGALCDQGKRGSRKEVQP